MQTETVKSYYTPNGKTKFRALATLGDEENVEQQELSLIACGKAQQYSYFGREFGDFLKTTHTSLPYKLAIMLLEIYPKT